MAFMEKKAYEPDTKYDWDLFVIGGGSGGLATSKAAADYGARVAVADFVKPSPQGTKWGLGGTCVNVGCIPKKLFHTAALHAEHQRDSHGLGWDVRSVHNYEAMMDNVNNYIKSLNFGYRTDLRGKNVKYFNAFATFKDAHTLELDDGKGGKQTVTAKYVLVACGGRPNLGGYPGADECCLSSDDIFWRKKAPGKTLVVGASYIALECAGFLCGLGFDTTIMVRSILLRGFDQDIADRIGGYMEKHGAKFVREKIPSKFEKTADGRVKVFVDDKEYDTYDTVLLAIGRTGCASWLNLDAAGVKWEAKSGKIFADEKEKTNVENVYAIGDILVGKPELTPVAIKTGKLLASRLFSNGTAVMDYTRIPTTVFTPLEYGCVGLSEDEAKKSHGERVKVYHTLFKPLEWQTNPERPADACYIKMLVDTQDDERLLGLHILGPVAGEIIQACAVALRAGARKADFDETVGIHPIMAEELCQLTEVKEDGKALAAKSGC